MSTLLSPRVVRNFGALMVLQGGNYVIPLLLVPYLVRVLGLDVFGTWMFVFSFVVIARVCVSYGFDLTATRTVASIGRGDPAQLSSLLADIVLVRLLIWLATFAFAMALTVPVEALRDLRPLMAIAFLILIGDVLLPVWLYQGLETMGTLVWVRLGAKLANLALVIAFVRGPEDVLLVPLLEAATAIAGGLIALAIAARRFALVPALPHPSRIARQIKDGGPVFLATAAVQLYTTLNMIVLGFLAGPAAVGAYAIAEKVYVALRGLLTPFVQAIFPAMSRFHETAHDVFIAHYHAVLRYLALILIAAGIALFALAGMLVWILAGEANADATTTLQVFALSMPFALGSFLAPMVVARGRNMTLMQVTLIGGALGLALCPLLAWAYGAPGAAGGFLIVQAFNSVALYIVNRPAKA